MVSVAIAVLAMIGRTATAKPVEREVTRNWRRVKSSCGRAAVISCFIEYSLLHCFAEVVERHSWSDAPFRTWSAARYDDRFGPTRGRRAGSR